MTLEEQLAELKKGLETALETKNKEQITSAITDFEAKSKGLFAEEVKGMKETLANEFKAQIKVVQDHADKLDAKLQAKEKGVEVKGHATLRGALNEAFKTKASEIKAIVDAGGNQSAPLFIEVKAAVDMSVLNTIGSGATQISITDNTNVISTIRKRTETYLANVTTGNTSGNRAMWIEETDEQGAPLFIGEGVAKPQASVRYVEKTANVKKIAVFGKVTTEMMADTPQLISYIQNNLAKRLELVKENGLFLGDNVGDNLNGIKNVATAFAAGAALNTIKFANEFDVLDAIGTQVELAFGVPNAVFVNPVTLQKMRAIKTTYGEPIYKDYQDIHGGINVHGMRIISTTLVPVGEFLGGDMTAVNVLFREGLNIQIGLDGNDFTNNKKTILLEQRLVQYVSANDTQVIIKGTFAAAITALLAP